MPFLRVLASESQTPLRLDFQSQGEVRTNPENGIEETLKALHGIPISLRRLPAKDFKAF